MKLKTKFQDEDFELGEVVEADIFYGGPESSLKVETRSAKGGYHTFYCDSLKELNNLFEDVPEEPTTYYYISDFGSIREGDVGKFVEDEIARKEIGNYFATEEEAEKAVERMQARKRLKDNRFRFETFGYDMETVKNGRVNLMIRATFDEKYGDGSVKLSDLDLLFGGEE